MVGEILPRANINAISKLFSNYWILELREIIEFSEGSFFFKESEIFKGNDAN